MSGTEAYALDLGARDVAKRSSEHCCAVAHRFADEDAWRSTVRPGVAYMQAKS